MIEAAHSIDDVFASYARRSDKKREVMCFGTLITYLIYSIVSSAFLRQVNNQWDGSLIDFNRRTVPLIDV